MKHKLSNRDKMQIKEKLFSEEIMYLEKIKNQKFNVGDILIKKTITLNEGEVSEQSIETYENSFLSVRYLVVHVDDNTGISFYKMVLENGKLDKDLECTVSTDDIGYGGAISFFEVDPSFVDAVIFGEEFDLSGLLEEERQRKAQLVKMNRSSAVIFNNLKDVNNFINSLSPRDMLYYHYNDKEAFNYNDFQSLKLKKPRKVKLYIYKLTRNFRNKIGKVFAKPAINDTYILYLRCLQSNRLITTCDLIGKALYKTKPIMFKEQP